MVLDTHVHLRDFEKQRYKETVRHGLEVARDSGVYAVFDMPNPDPPVLEEATALERLKLADDANVPEVFYGTYMGLTAEPEQVKRAIQAYRKHFPRIVGFKLYAGHSVGKLGVIRVEDQLSVYGTLAEEGYDGMMPVHAEKESELYNHIFNPAVPISHCLARPEKAEIESVRDQLALARYTKFKGKLHIAHISSPKSVELVDEAKSKGMDVSCGICPHHFIYDMSQMFSPEGILWKMNPPLREAGAPNLMLNYLREGKIDWVETDHAPHGDRINRNLDEKNKHTFMSGIPGLPWWPVFKEYLFMHNFTPKRVEEITFTAARNRFGIDVKEHRLQLKDRRTDYLFNPYMSIEQMVGWQSE